MNRAVSRGAGWLAVWLLLGCSAAAVTGCNAGGGQAAADAEAARAAEQAAAEARLREQAEREREARRLAALWTYHDTTVGDARQVTAVINSVEDIDTDGLGPRLVRLVFRDHASWGRSSYLLLQTGDFACPRTCTVQVTAGAGASVAMAATRPPTDEAIALFIEDADALWRMARTGDRLGIEFPVRIGGTRIATFEVGGLEGARMPGWDAPPAR